MKRENDFSQGSVARNIIELALPMTIAQLINVLYNVVDRIYIGRIPGDGKVALTGLGLTFPIITIITAFANLIGMGGTPLSSIERGKGNNEKAEKIMSNSFTMLLILGIVLTIVGLLVKKPILYLFGASDITFPYADSYISIYLLGTIFVMMGLGLNSYINAQGFAKVGMLSVALGAVINLVLDPIFIYSFKWEVLGAALATLIAQMIMFFLYMKIGGKWFEFHWKKAFHSERIKAIVNLGWAVAFQRILFTLINILLAKLIAKFGPEAIAAQKIGLQIESVTYMVTGGLNGAVASFTGQNYGAHYYKRIKKGYQVAIGLSISYAVLTTTLFMIFAIPMANIFVKDATTIQMTSVYLQIIAYSQLFNAIEMVSNGWFTGIQKPQIPATISMLFTALRLPMAWLLVIPLGLEGIWWSISISTLLKGSILYFCYKHYQGKLKEQEI